MTHIREVGKYRLGTFCGPVSELSSPVAVKLVLIQDLQQRSINCLKRSSKLQRPKRSTILSSGYGVKNPKVAGQPSSQTRVQLLPTLFSGEKWAVCVQVSDDFRPMLGLEMNSPWDIPHPASLKPTQLERAILERRFQEIPGHRLIVPHLEFTIQPRAPILHLFAFQKTPTKFQEPRP